MGYGYVFGQNVGLLVSVVVKNQVFLNMKILKRKLGQRTKEVN